MKTLKLFLMFILSVMFVAMPVSGYASFPLTSATPTDSPQEEQTTEGQPDTNPEQQPSGSPEAEAQESDDLGHGGDGHLHTEVGLDSLSLEVGMQYGVSEDASEALPEVVESYGLYPKWYRDEGISTFAIGGDGAVAKFVADNHSLMLRADGRLLVWGDNRYGQLGLGSGAPNTVYEPTELTFFKKMGAKIIDIMAIADASFVLLDSGELYSFGKGTNGRLGLGHSNNVNVPTLIPDSQILKIHTLHGGPGREFIMAETDFNTLYAWGRNNYGQLGTGDKIDVNAPTKIMDNANVKRLNLGLDFVTLQKTDGSYWVWGNNASGQYGFNTVVNPSNLSISCASGSCVGNNYTKISNNTFVWTPMPPNYSVIFATAGILEFGLSHQLPYQIKKVTGWQFNDLLSQFSEGSDPGGTLTSSSANTFNFSTSVTGNHWYNSSGDKHSSTVTATWRYIFPNAYTYFNTSKLVDLQLGNSHGIANIDGTYYGWGGNGSGQQGTSGNANGYMTPLTSLNQFMSGLSGDSFSDFKVDGDTGFILTTNGNVYAVGANTSGKAGIGATTSTSTPEQIIALYGESIADVIPGRNTTFFIGHDGSVYASGDNQYGQAGLGEEQGSTLTTPKKIETFKYSSTELPPDAPGSLNAPQEVSAGEEIVIEWSGVANAAGYELKRSVTYNDSGILLLAGDDDSETIYAGDQTTFTDTAQESWVDGAIVYSVHATNSIGDYSDATKSSQIKILAVSGGGGNPPPSGGDGDNNNNNNGGGLSNEDLLALIAALTANTSTGALTYEQMLTLLNNSTGDVSYSDLASLLERYGRSGNINVNVPDSGTDDKALTSLLAALVASNGSNTVPTLPTANVYNQGTDINELLEILDYLTPADAQTNLSPENSLDAIDIALKTATLKVLDTLGPQLTNAAQISYRQLPSQIISLYIIVSMIVVTFALIIVRIIPEREEDLYADT